MRPLTTRPAATTCEHGRLARSCEVCERTADRDEALALLRAYLVPEGEPGAVTPYGFEQLVRAFLAGRPTPASRP